MSEIDAAGEVADDPLDEIPVLLSDLRMFYQALHVAASVSEADDVREGFRNMTAHTSALTTQLQGSKARVRGYLETAVKIGEEPDEPSVS